MYDFIIVGAGVAGLTLAETLSRERRCEVAVIEAGDRGFPSRASTAYNIAVGKGEWRHRVSLSNGREVLYPGGRGIGGSGRINASLALRPVPADFDDWRDAAGEIWSWDSVLDDFRELERDLDFPASDFHGARGAVPVRRWRKAELVDVQRGFIASCLRLGFAECVDHNAPNRYGVGPWPMNRRGPHRQSPSEVFKRQLTERSNVRFLLNATVERVIIERGKASGVELVDGNKISGRRIALCAGTWISPAILAASGVGPGGREVDNPNVGQNLIDHPRVDITGTLRPVMASDLAGPRFQSLLRHGIANPGDVQIYPASYYSRVKRELLRQPNSDPLYFGGLTVVVTRPTSRGVVYTTPASSRRTEPIAELPVLKTSEDLELMRRAVRLAWKIISGPELSKYFLEFHQSDEQIRSDRLLDSFIRSQVHCAYHAVGSCRMGIREVSSVVSPTCAVHGVENFYIADASVFPALPRANTCLTTMMVAKRLPRLQIWTV